MSQRDGYESAVYRCRECGDEVAENERIYDSDQLERVHMGVIPKDGEQPRCPDCAPSDQTWRGDS